MFGKGKKEKTDIRNHDRNHSAVICDRYKVMYSWWCDHGHIVRGES